MVFCMFAEDVNLLPNNLFKKMLEASLSDPGSFQENARQLFAAMHEKGGRVGFERVEWFNGGLFDDDTALPLEKQDVEDALAAARLDWSNIDPSIMGTLFERGLDPDKRSQLGAHYTDAEKIMLIVNPVIVEPLAREWETILPRIQEALSVAEAARTEAARTRAAAKAGALTRRANATQAEAERLRGAYLERLRGFRVLDPACGSGNFLYIALRELKDLEHRANLQAEALGLPREFPRVGPECVRGIEINPFAAELARVSVWVGEIQWMQRHGFDATRNPILKPLETIECRDALLDQDGNEAQWPKVNAIVGNPPFLGGKWMIDRLGPEYTARLRAKFVDRIDPSADLVSYWFEKARAQLVHIPETSAGFVATNMIRSTVNRRVMTEIAKGGAIFNAWSDEPWVVEGADVRVSLVCYRLAYSGQQKLNDRYVNHIHPDLSGGSQDLTKAKPLTEMQNRAVRGIERGGPFDVSGELARSWLAEPINPNGKHNSVVLRRFITVRDLLGRSQDRWIIDFGQMASAEAALFEKVYAYASANIRELRALNREERTALRWWQHRRSGAAFYLATAPLERFIATGLVTKYRFFVWLEREGIVPDTRIVAISRDDDCCFGILSSNIHTVWTLNTCQFHGVGNDPVYTIGSCFETFPFPEGLSPDISAASYANNPRAVAIATAARQLDSYRERWLNPPDWVVRVPEVVTGYPDRVMPRQDLSEDQTEQLKRRTMTDLYNERPAWLANAHRALDEAVADAYGWPRDLTDDEILERLFYLNRERSDAQH